MSNKFKNQNVEVSVDDETPSESSKTPEMIPLIVQRPIEQFDLYCAAALHALVEKGLPTQQIVVQAKSIAQAMVEELKK
jgi:hypothetical protein